MSLKHITRNYHSLHKSSLALNGGGRIFFLPVLSLIFPACSLVLSRLIYWETLSALLFKLKNYGFDQLVSQRNWHHLLDEKRRYLPIRNHDNRSSADWIRLCPGLSKNSENGNSCPKPHKAAVMIEAVGRAVSIETETINRNMDSIMEKLTALHRRPEWTKRVAVELECGYSPQD